MKIKIDFNKVVGLAPLVAGLVRTAQQLLKPGAAKKAIVIAQVKALLPVVEGVTEKDLVDDAAFNAALSSLIDLEKATLAARAHLAAVIEDIKAKAEARKLAETEPGLPFNNDGTQDGA
jgi:hypothetical protein